MAENALTDKSPAEIKERKLWLGGQQTFYVPVVKTTDDSLRKKKILKSIIEHNTNQ